MQLVHQQTHAIAAPPQHFEQITAFAAKHEDVPAERIPFKHGLHLGGETVESGPHVGHAGSQPYTRAARKTDHVSASAAARNVRNTTRSVAASGVPSMRTRATPTLISITPATTGWPLLCD